MKRHVLLRMTNPLVARLRFSFQALLDFSASRARLLERCVCSLGLNLELFELLLYAGINYA